MDATEPYGGADISMVTSNLWVGGSLSPIVSRMAHQVQGIIDAGITHVLDLRAEDEDHELWDSLGIEYLHLGTTDAAGHHIPSLLFDKALAFAKQAKKDKGVLLVHCHMGVNRAPSVVYAILMDRGTGPWAAYDLIRAKRPQAGLAYASDAYRHFLEGIPRDAAERRVQRLLGHIDQVLSREDVKEINRYIGTRHQKHYSEVLEQIRQDRRSNHE